MRPILYKFRGDWVKMDDPTNMRVAMCEIYPDSAPADWLLRLRRWHVPAAVSPLHDMDTYDSDKIIPSIKKDPETGAAVRDKNGQPVYETDLNGEPLMLTCHLKGEKKKPHYHLMIAYGNSTTRKAFMRIIKDIGGVVPPWEHMEVCSVMSMYRYFCHKDDPDKFQYDENDIMLLGGFDPVNYQTYADKNEPFNEVLSLLKEHKEIRSYKSVAYYYKGRDNRMFYFVMNHTVAISGLFKTGKV